MPFCCLTHHVVFQQRLQKSSFCKCYLLLSLHLLNSELLLLSITLLLLTSSEESLDQVNEQPLRKLSSLSVIRERSDLVRLQTECGPGCIWGRICSQKGSKSRNSVSISHLVRGDGEVTRNLCIFWMTEFIFLSFSFLSFSCMISYHDYLISPYLIQFIFLKGKQTYMYS